MSLPKFTSDDFVTQQIQNTWAAQLDPLLANPLTAGLTLNKISLVAGLNTINHKLGRKLQGWVMTRQRAAAAVYDVQDANQRPDLTLQLQCSAPVVIDLYVY